MRVHPKLLCNLVAPYFAGPENPHPLSHKQFATLPGASERISHSLVLVYGRSAASGLPCAGAAPPQRPPRLATVFTLPPASCLANGAYSPPCRFNPLTPDPWSLAPNPCSSAPPQRPALATHVAGSFPPSWHADNAPQPTWLLPTEFAITEPG